MNNGPSDRIYFMGRSGAEKKGDAEQSEASDSGSTTSRARYLHTEDFLAVSRSVRRMHFWRKMV